jgi:hypothetical protein
MPGRGMYYDLMGRAPHYITDWTDGEISPEPIFAVAHVLREHDLYSFWFSTLLSAEPGQAAT